MFQSQYKLLLMKKEKYRIKKKRFYSKDNNSNICFQARKLKINWKRLTYHYYVQSVVTNASNLTVSIVHEINQICRNLEKKQETLNSQKLLSLSKIFLIGCNEKSPMFCEFVKIQQYDTKLKSA